MKRFWVRFARLNAPLLASTLREIAHQIEVLEPGSPSVGFPIIFIDSKGKQHMDITVKDDSVPIPAVVSFVDAHNFPTEPDTPPVWASDNEASATVGASEDGLSAIVGANGFGAPGAAIISCETTNEDGTVVRCQGTITVTPAEAAVGTIDFQPPA